MTIKKFAFEVQSALSKAHDIDLKRSHVYEVLAALFGFASYTALTSQLMLAQHDGQVPATPLDIAQAAARAMDLGYAPPAPPIIAAEIAHVADTERLFVVSMEDVLAQLDLESDGEELVDAVDDAFDPEDYNADGDRDAEDEEPTPYIDLDSPVLRESLLRMADAGSASAHLAIAQLDEDLLDLESTDTSDGRYWFEQQRSGRVLKGVELEWAETYRREQEARSSWEKHLRRAADLGNAEAAFRLVEEVPSDENFELAARLARDEDAAWLGELALSCGRADDARKWLRMAAQGGDTDAMKLLASELEPDLEDAWTWVHLARLLEVDVMAYDAVGEDGLPTDADEAGPIYAAGGFKLDRLSIDADESAKLRARELYKSIAPR